jgi:hypothetical protein
VDILPFATSRKATIFSGRLIPHSSVPASCITILSAPTAADPTFSHSNSTMLSSALAADSRCLALPR